MDSPLSILNFGKYEQHPALLQHLGNNLRDSRLAHGSF